MMLKAASEILQKCGNLTGKTTFGYDQSSDLFQAEVRATAKFEVEFGISQTLPQVSAEGLASLLLVRLQPVVECRRQCGTCAEDPGCRTRSSLEVLQPGHFEERTADSKQVSGIHVQPQAQAENGSGAREVRFRAHDSSDRVQSVGQVVLHVEFAENRNRDGKTTPRIRYPVLPVCQMAQPRKGAGLSRALAKDAKDSKACSKVRFGFGMVSGTLGQHSGHVQKAGLKLPISKRANELQSRTAFRFSIPELPQSVCDVARQQKRSCSQCLVSG